jgi:hypothetical protein
MLVGYMGARGLMSGALLPGLAPNEANSETKHTIRDGVLPSLVDAVLAHGESLGNDPPRGMHERFKSYVESLCRVERSRTVISVVPSSGLDSRKRPTVGSLLRIDHEVTALDGAVSTSVAASFFVHEPVRVLECVGAPKSDPWQVSDELLIHHVRRTFTDTPNVAVVSDRDYVTNQR